MQQQPPQQQNQQSQQQPPPGQQPYYSYGQQPPYGYGQPYAVTAKDPNTAFIIEMIAGFFGFLGVGYMYAGRTSDGLLRLIGWWVFLAVAWLVSAILTIIIVGFCLMLVLVIAQFGVPIYSGLSLKKEMEMQMRPPGYMGPY
jgi:TM2 domain-containing membrane protein YozV